MGCIRTGCGPAQVSDSEQWGWGSYGVGGEGKAADQVTGGDEQAHDGGLELGEVQPEARARQEQHWITGLAAAAAAKRLRQQQFGSRVE